MIAMPETMANFHSPGDAHDDEELEVEIPLAFLFLEGFHFL
jgi:hypothetical protein